MSAPVDITIDWHELSRASIAKHVHRSFAEECYVLLVGELARQADESEAAPKNVAISFVRAQGKWQKNDVPAIPPLMVRMRATYNGEWHDYEALLPDHYDPLFLRTIQ